MSNLFDAYNESKDVEPMEANEGGAGDFHQPDTWPGGETRHAQVFSAKLKTTPAGGKAFMVTFVDLEDEDAGLLTVTKWFSNVEKKKAEKGEEGEKSAKAYNKRLFMEFADLGLDDTFMVTGPSEEAMAKRIKDQAVEVDLTPAWDDEPSKRGTYFTDGINCVWVPRDAAEGELRPNI